jgi:hypothetical protein
VSLSFAKLLCRPKAVGFGRIEAAALDVQLVENKVETTAERVEDCP